MQAYLTHENLQKIPFYEVQEKELLLNFFDVVNTVFKLFLSDSSRSPLFFTQEIKEVHYAKTIEHITNMIIDKTQLLELGS